MELRLRGNKLGIHMTHIRCDAAVYSNILHCDRTITETVGRCFCPETTKNSSRFSYRQRYIMVNMELLRFRGPKWNQSFFNFWWNICHARLACLLGDFTSTACLLRNTSHTAPPPFPGEAWSNIFLVKQALVWNKFPPETRSTEGLPFFKIC